MAAAEYFSSGTRPSFEQSNSLHPPPRPPRAHSQPGHTYQLRQSGYPSPQLPAQSPQYANAPPPPPYQPLTEGNKPQAHFAPTPSAFGQHRPSLPNPPRPDPYSFTQPNYQAQQLAPYQQGPFVPQPYTYQPQPYLRPDYRPGPKYSSADLGPAHGYSSDPESHRRKHKRRPRRISSNSRSTDTDGFLGAAGGGLLGDMLCPGLGTVGGALVGWVGGKDYGKHRKWREEKRDRDQERWEQQFGSRSRSRSQDRRGSHERRKGYD